ncbi:MAG: hypothetical protein ACLP8B_13965, partial [Xanthobacteraceae bacterium]
MPDAPVTLRHYRPQDEDDTIALWQRTCTNPTHTYTDGVYDVTLIVWGVGWGTPAPKDGSP